MSKEKRLVEYNHKKEELKHLNEQITKQDDMIEHKPEEPSNKDLHINGVGVVGFAIVGYLLYNKFKKPEQSLIDVPPPANFSHETAKIELKRYIFLCVCVCVFVCVCVCVCTHGR